MKPYYTPREVDDMCLWEVGVILGVDQPEEGGAQMRGTESIEERMEREKHTLAERAAKIREVKGQEDRDITDSVMRQMGIRT